MQERLNKEQEEKIKLQEQLKKEKLKQEKLKPLLNTIKNSNAPMHYRPRARSISGKCSDVVSNKSPERREPKQPQITLPPLSTSRKFLVPSDDLSVVIPQT
jgi:hypothetical protein